MVTFWTFTSVTFKSRSQKPGYYVILIRYIYMYDNNLFESDPAISSGVNALFFPRWPPGSHIGSPIRPKFSRKVDGAEIHVHTRLECSRSNSNETCQYWCRFELSPLRPSKVGQIKNLGIMSCILIRCTYDKNLEMIQPLVHTGVYHFVGWTPIGPKSGWYVDGA
jgi:hypothetical protein